MLQQLPAALPLYLKASLSARKKPKGKPSIPALATSLPGLAIEPARLAAYESLCGFSASEHLPVTYPQVLAAPIHMHLMTRPEFPLPLLGLVHLRNHIEQRRALGRDERFDVAVRLGESREVRQGLEFDLATEFAVEGEIVWQALTTILYRMGAPQKKGGKPAAEAPQLAEYRSFEAPADIGRRYARVSGDYNPIHMSAASAKLFGFPRAIAHGMWSLARCTALLQDSLGLPPAALDVQFRQPLLLPGQVSLKLRRGAPQLEFALLDRHSDKVHLTGSLR